MPKYSLMVARFPGNWSEHPDSSGYLIELAMSAFRESPDLERVVPYRKSDTPITMSRNHCVREALRKGCDYLLMIDSDMSPDLPGPGAKPFWETSWEFLLGHRHTPCAVAAPYCGPPPHENVYVFRWSTRQSDHPDPDFRLEQFPREEAAAKTGIEEVAALPTGLILFDTRVFKNLEPPWFRYEWKDEYEDQKATTEDVYMTRNASLRGMPMYCNWDAWAGHVKLKVVGKPQVIGPGDVARDLREAVLRDAGGLRTRDLIAESNGQTHRKVEILDPRWPGHTAPSRARP